MQRRREGAFRGVWIFPTFHTKRARELSWAHAEDQSQCRENHTTHPLNSTLSSNTHWHVSKAREIDDIKQKYAADRQTALSWKQVCVHFPPSLSRYLYMIRSNVQFLLVGLHIIYNFMHSRFKQSHLYACSYLLAAHPLIISCWRSWASFQTYCQLAHVLFPAPSHTGD